MEENPPTATEPAAGAVSEPGMCRGCQERDREILRLRKQLGLPKSTDALRRGTRWWILLILGLTALTLMPGLSLPLIIPALLYDSDFAILAAVAQGAIYTTPVAQHAIIGMLALLHWRPARQRIPVGFGAAVLIGLVAAIPYTYFIGGSESLELFRIFATSLPIAMTIACCPIFIARSIYGWTLGARDQTPPPRSTTLLSYLGAMAFAGAATACLRWTDTSEFGQGGALRLAVVFIVYVAAPSAITGCVLAILAPAILRRPRWSWKKRAACLASLALVSVIGSLSFLVALIVETDDVQDIWSAEMMHLVFGFGLGITAIAIVVSSAALGWMRLLGYRLYTKSECVAEDMTVSNSQFSSSSTI